MEGKSLCELLRALVSVTQIYHNRFITTDSSSFAVPDTGNEAACVTEVFLHNSLLLSKKILKFIMIDFFLNPKFWHVE